MLEQIDALARQKAVSRSSFIREAIRAALRREREAALAERIDAVFADAETTQAQAETSESFLAASAVASEDDAW